MNAIGEPAPPPAPPKAPAPPAPPMGIRQAFREMWRGLVAVWWGFFDWLAAVSWKTLLLVSFLGLLFAAILFSVGTSIVTYSPGIGWPTSAGAIAECW